jgi:hypothetical protein
MAKQQIHKTTTTPSELPQPKSPSGNFDDAFTGLNDALVNLQNVYPDPLTPADRKRLMGAGTKRYGFIDRAMDYAEEYPQFAPTGGFSIADLLQAKTDIEQLRDLQILADQVSRLISDGLLIAGDRANSLALIYYSSVRGLAKRNVPGAIELFQKLKQAFMRSKSGNNEPTEEEEIRDAIALIHGKKEGEIVIKNEHPHLVGGKHEVIDSVHSGHTAVKEVIKAEE